MSCYDKCSLSITYLLTLKGVSHQEKFGMKIEVKGGEVVDFLSCRENDVVRRTELFEVFYVDLLSAGST